MRASAFTLVELTLVMALMVVMLALVAPTLSSSLHGQGLSGEATRFVALTEFARSEAVSQGVPMVVWIAPKGSQYGAEAKPGYEPLPTSPRVYAGAPDVKIEASKAPLVNGHLQAASFAPDGALSLESADSVVFTDRFGSSIVVVRNAGGWGYEVGGSRR